MNAQPAPFTPADCDLRGFEWMPLFGARLFASTFEAHASDLAFRVAIRLYWECWQQVPAASLPNDDVQLCRLAGLGRDIKTWRKLRADGVLHGFILCTDDRLYHGMLAEEATKAWEGRRKKDQERDHWRDKKRRQRANGSNGHDGDVPRDIERCPQRRPLNVPRDVPRDVPGDVPFSPQTPLSHSVQETGQERELASASSARARTRLHPLPDDWKPNLLSQEKALRLGFDTADIGRVAEELCTWAKANDERKADWDAQFDRFVLREASQRAAGRQRGENVIQHPKAQLTKIQFRSGALEHAWDRAERLADGTS
jgi:hypothetical protein